MEIESYDIDLGIDFHNARVDGQVLVELSRGERPLVLDAVGLDITGVKVNGSGAQYSLDRNSGTLRIQGVPAGASKVLVSYKKQVSDDVIFGLYKSKYGGEYMLVTDLEPAEARTVFPCKDDPSVKAVFKLSITTDQGLSVISNTPVASKTRVGSKVRFVFEPTPRMSTYLLFFGVGRFEEISKRSGGKEVLVASQPGEARNGRFILGVASAALSHYEKYYGVRYPLKKLHIVALPEYHTGAMENWGAITSREAYVLLNKGASASDMQAAALVIAHEIAHQWFGDLVTMKWWNDLWLNESFATFMECKAIGALHPEWDAWSFFLRSQTFRSKATDALTDTHPIEVAVKTPREAGQVFDAISYGKGASVLRMVESFVGEEAFRRGVSAYLKQFSYKNATGEDLWKSVQRASGKPVSRIMGEWVRLPGLPLVRVDEAKGSLRFSQRRFQLNGEESKEVWPIPLTFSVNGRRRTALLDAPVSTVRVPRVRSLIVNLGHAGFYNVLYSPELYEKLAENFRDLGPYEKGGLVNDLFLFMLAGKVSPDVYFRFVSLCSDERAPLVVETIADHLSMLNSIANESRLFQRHASAFALAQAERLGFRSRRGESPRDRVARESVSVLLSRIDTKLTAKLASMFAHYQVVDPDVKEAAAIAYARTAKEDAFGGLVGMVKSSKSEVDRSRIYAALTSFSDPRLVEKVLELGISGEVSRSDSAYAMTLAAGNPLARGVLWDWLQKRYDRLWSIYGGSQQIILYYEAVVPRCAVGKVGEVREFFSGDRMKQGGPAFKRIVESVEIRTKLREVLLAAG